METIIIQTEGSKLKLLKQLLKEPGIAHESGKKAKDIYDREYSKNIKIAALEPSRHVNSANLWEDLK